MHDCVFSNSTLATVNKLLTSQTKAFGPNQIVQTDYCALTVTLSDIVDIQKHLQRSCC